MPVIVRLPQTGTGRDRTRTHPLAEGIDVDDGHLILTAGTGRSTVVVAAYAPTAWMLAELADTEISG